MPHLVSKEGRSLIAYLTNNENNRRLCKNYPVPSISTEGLADIGASLSREPNNSTNTCQLISHLFTVHRLMSIEIKGSDYTRTTNHTTLGMAICMTSGDPK